MSEINWREIGAALRAPFGPADVDFRPQGKPNSSGKVQAVCYIDARTVADRLDDVVGPGAWEFTYEPLVTANGQVQIAKGRLSIHGVVKEDVGEASNFDPSKGCVSDALKRAAVLWGIGRYLYGIGGEWVTADQYGRINDEDVKRLRAKLPRPGEAAENASVRAPQPNLGEQRAKTPPSTSAAPAPSQRVTDGGGATATATATKDQRERMRKYREALAISDDSIARADNLLDQTAAEGRISEYIRMWQRRNVVGTGATA